MIIHKKNLHNSFKWSFISDWSAKLSQPILFIILVRLLSPEDFGVMASAFLVVAFTQVLWEAGLNKALIQTKSDITESSNIMFFMNIGLSILVIAGLLLSSGLIARVFFHDDRVSPVLDYMTIYIALNALSSVHIALLQREMQFKKIFWVKLTTTLLPPLISIPLAIYNFGYWSLVIGNIFSQLILAIVSWSVCNWRPSLTFKKSASKKMIEFGSWVTASGLLNWFYIWADALIIGYFLSTHELGIYRTGNQFAILVFALLIGPISPVLYSYLSKIDTSSIKIKVISEKLLKILTLLCIPTAFIIYSQSLAIETLLFGEQWKGIQLVIGALSLTHGISWIVGLNGDIYRAIGKPSYDTVVTAGTLTVYVVAYIIAIRYSFEHFVWTRLALALTATCFHLILLKQIVKISLSQVLFLAIRVTAYILASIYLIDIITSYDDTNSWAQLILGSTSIFLVFLIFIIVLERKLIHEILPIKNQKRAT